MNGITIAIPAGGKAFMRPGNWGKNWPLCVAIRNRELVGHLFGHRQLEPHEGNLEW